MGFMNGLNDSKRALGKLLYNRNKEPYIGPIRNKRKLLRLIYRIFFKHDEPPVVKARQSRLT